MTDREDIPSRVYDAETPAVQLPWSNEAEQAVLGALMLDNAAFDKISDVLSAQMFWHGANKAVFEAVAALIGSGRPADTITVFDALKTAKNAPDFGGIGYVNSLSSSSLGAWNIRRYALIVAEKAAQRALIEAADQALAISRGTDTVGDKLDKIAAAFAGVQRTQMKKAPKRIGELLIAAIDRYTDLAEGKTTPGWATGIAPLDRLLNGGLRPGKVYGIAARPSVGKSTAARSIGLHIAELGHPVLLLSQEMPNDEVADCVVAELGSIDGRRLQTGNFTDDDWRRMTEGVEAGAHMPFYVDDDGGLTIGDMRGKARMVKGLKVLMVDYLQLSTSTLKGANRNDQVAEISSGLKQLAMQMGVAVVVLSQLSRKVEERADKEPILSDLRESGSIEQDLDVCVMLWTIEEPDNGPRLVGWKVEKHRGGKKGRFPMELYPAVYRWDETHRDMNPKSAQNGGQGRKKFE